MWISIHSSFTYIGSDVDSEGYSSLDIHKRLGMASSIMSQLDNVWRQQRLSLSTKLRIYSSLVQSVALYGSKTWTLRKVDNSRIQSFHMQALCRILGIRLYDKVSSAAVWKRTKLPDLLSLITDRRHSIFGHVCRLPKNTPALQTLQLSIDAHTGTAPTADWKRPPGRPRRTWLQQIEEDCGISVGLAQVTSQDRINQSINQTRQFLTRHNTAKPLQGRNRTRPPRPTL